MIYVPVHLRRVNFIWHYEVWSIIGTLFVSHILWGQTHCWRIFVFLGPGLTGQDPVPLDWPCVGLLVSVQLMEGILLFLWDLWKYSISQWIWGRPPVQWPGQWWNELHYLAEIDEMMNTGLCILWAAQGQMIICLVIFETSPERILDVIKYSSALCEQIYELAFFILFRFICKAIIGCSTYILEHFW